MASFDGTTRTVSMPAFLTPAFMAANLDATFTWRGPGPTVKDTGGCNAGPSANYKFESSDAGWNGTYRMTIGSYPSGYGVDIEWRGWGANLYDAAGALVATGSNHGIIAATLVLSGGTTWVLEHAGGQVGATPWACH